MSEFNGFTIEEDFGDVRRFHQTNGNQPIEVTKIISRAVVGNFSDDDVYVSSFTVSLLEVELPSTETDYTDNILGLAVLLNTHGESEICGPLMQPCAHCAYKIVCRLEADTPFVR